MKYLMQYVYEFKADLENEMMKGTTTSIYFHAFQDANARTSVAIANVLDFSKKETPPPDTERKREKDTFDKDKLWIKGVLGAIMDRRSFGVNKKSP